MDNELRANPSTLMVFIDETGVEDFSDPKNPTFGRGGCAIVGSEYRPLIKKPWRKLKREKLGGAKKPFHATDFEQTRPTLVQIHGINKFLRQPFWRFAVMSDIRTSLPLGIDAHKAISLVTVNFIKRVVLKSPYITDVALIFEQSDRGDRLVKRDFDLAKMNLVNARGCEVEVDGCFMPKTSMEPGLEVADLIAHTAGRQRRHQLAHREGSAKDFQHMFWHSPIPPAFMSIDSAQLTELSVEST